MNGGEMWGEVWGRDEWGRGVGGGMNGGEVWGRGKKRMGERCGMRGRGVWVGWCVCVTVYCYMHMFGCDLSQAIYERLFTGIVQRINRQLEVKVTRACDSSVIGVLDIYGFEIFENNRFASTCVDSVTHISPPFPVHTFTL